MVYGSMPFRARRKKIAQLLLYSEIQEKQIKPSVLDIRRDVYYSPAKGL